MDTLCNRCGRFMIVKQVTIADRDRTIKLFCPNHECRNRVTVQDMPAVKEREHKAHHA